MRWILRSGRIRGAEGWLWEENFTCVFLCGLFHGGASDESVFWSRSNAVVLLVGLCANVELTNVHSSEVLHNIQK